MRHGQTRSRDNANSQVETVVILTYYCYHSTRWGWFVVGHSALILSLQSPSHCQCVVVSGSLCISQYLRSDVVSSILSHCTAVYCPGDSSGRTTSGGGGESECWNRSIQLWCQLKLHRGNYNRPCGWDSTLSILLGLLYIKVWQLHTNDHIS